MVLTSPLTTSSHILLLLSGLIFVPDVVHPLVSSYFQSRSNRLTLTWQCMWAQNSRILGFSLYFQVLHGDFVFNIVNDKSSITWMLETGFEAKMWAYGDFLFTVNAQRCIYNISLQHSCRCLVWILVQLSHPFQSKDTCLSLVPRN